MFCGVCCSVVQQCSASEQRRGFMAWKCYPALLAPRTGLTWVAVWIVPEEGSLGMGVRTGGTHWGLGAGGWANTSRTGKKVFSGPPVTCIDCLLYIFTRLPLSATEPRPGRTARPSRPGGPAPEQTGRRAYSAIPSHRPCCGGTSRLQPCLTTGMSPHKSPPVGHLTSTLTVAITVTYSNSTAPSLSCHSCCRNIVKWHTSFFPPPNTLQKKKITT